MFTYNSLVESCRNAKLDPTLSGTNIYAGSYPVETFKTPIDLKVLNFPSKELEEVEKIGKLIYNLLSQKKFPAIYYWGKNGKEERRRDRSIDTFIPIAKESQKFWFKQGLESVSSENRKRQFMLHNGLVYEIDPAYQIGMNRINESAEKTRREFIIKTFNSERSASDIILNR